MSWLYKLCPALELSKHVVLNLEYSANLFMNDSGMSAKFITLAFIMVLATECLALPLSQSENEMEKASAQPWERRLRRGAAGAGSDKAVQTRDARMERLPSLPEDQREFMSKQILQALSEIIHRDDCISDYQGWVDFGRRSSD